jgi:hypothetical protein
MYSGLAIGPPIVAFTVFSGSTSVSAEGLSKLTRLDGVNNTRRRKPAVYLNG